MKTSFPSSVVTIRPTIALPHLSRFWVALGCAALAFAALTAHAVVTEAWVQRYNGPANLEDAPSMVAVDGSGNVVVTGTSFNRTNRDYYTAKYAARNGALLWERRYNGIGNGDDYGKAVVVDSSGNVVVTGSSSTTSYFFEYYTVKYAAADGAILWEKHYHGPSSYARATALAVDGNGNVVVTGSSWGAGGERDFYTAKYAAADGALLWEQRYMSAADRDAGATSLALDSSGNVIVTGQSRLTIGGGATCNTVKYAAADGALLWESVGNAEIGLKVAIDGGGNAVVIGTTYNSVNLTDYYTAKYAAADGALLWEQSYNGTENGQDTPTGVAVDPNGNVVVTGSSALGSDYASNNGYGAYMAKYAVADGTLLWEKRGSANPVNNEIMVVVDASGQVVVAGSSYNGSTSSFYTARYAATDGALLWEKRYSGSANGLDSVTSLALGPNGMVVITGSSTGRPSTDYATVVYRETLPPVSITMSPDGVRLRSTGDPGCNYNFERAPAVTGPWSTIATITAPPDGSIEYTDTNPPAGTAFYRTSAP